jgi:hypothetical protein
MVIFVVSPERPGSGWGALTNRTQRAILRTRRHKERSESEAWIGDEEGSINVR